MNREYHKWYSPSLGRDMELLIFGHAGVPILVFPTSMGRFYEYENHGMVGALWRNLEEGRIQLFCVDSVDAESWYNEHAHPADRVRRHQSYENYVMNEAIPLLRDRNWSPRIAVTGCSFGGYHAMNIALKHPGVFSDCIAMSGAFDIKRFLHGYYDENCYFNNPVDYVPNLSGGSNLGAYRSGHNFLLSAGDWDICLGENYRMADILGSKGIPHRLDVWGERRVHDWPLWQDMARAYFC